MAITAPRIIFACSIPTIIVILSYIWFKKKKETVCRRRSSSSSSSSRGSSSVVSFSCDVSKSGLNCIESNLEEESVEEQNTSSTASEYRIVETNVTITDLVSVVEGSRSFDGEPSSSSLEQIESQQLVEVNVPEVETIVIYDDTEVKTDKIVEMVFGTTADEVGDRYSESDKDAINATCRENGSNCNSPSSDRFEETVTKPCSTVNVCETVVVKEENGVLNRSLDAETRENGSSCNSPSSDRFEETVTKPSSTVNGSETAVDAENRENELQSEISDISENVKELRLSPQRESCGVGGNYVVPDQTSATDESNDDDNTLVEENVDTTVIVDSPVISKVQQEEEEEMPRKTHSPSSTTTTTVRDNETSDLSVSRSSPTTEYESEVAIVTATTVVIADHPPVASSPGSINDDQELHKLTNGTDTSAYGSASHSPAEELRESPTASNFSDMHSEGSSDSGKGCSEINAISADSSSSVYPFTPLSVFEFELPQELCGRLIGQKGRYVNLIKSKSKANISIKRHPFNAELKLCAVIGTEEDINNALIMIRKRFPINRFPLISMIQVNAPLLNNVPIPDTLQLHLPEGVTCDVIMSSLVNAGHFFVQQPTHPTYSSLGRLDQCMLHCYLNGMGAPELPKPVEPGVICSASTMGGWYRAQIVFVHSESEECEIRFVDYGGYLQTPISSLRQIRSDFMTLPFQASECYLANVVPIDETQGWTLEATSMFEELAQGQILQAQIVSYSDDGIPYVHIYRIQGVMTTFINRELVDCGFAKWIEHET